MSSDRRQAFDSLYTHGFARVAVCIPHVRVADPAFNAERTLELAQRASAKGAAVALFPELGLSSYSSEDLFHQDALLIASRQALRQLVDASADLLPVLLVGLPLRVDDRLFNCAAVVHRGRVLGLVPKSYLPNYREYYEKRHFAPDAARLRDEVELDGRAVPFGADLLFEASDLSGLSLSVEICEDLWAPLSPSTVAAVAGATVLCNLSASNVTVDKARYRRLLCQSQSGKCAAAYLYAGAGFGESTTDLAWDGHGMICENGELLTETERFSGHDVCMTADLDLDRLTHERMRLSSFTDSIERHRGMLAEVRRVSFELTLPTHSVALEREVPRFPYVPATSEARDERCQEAYNIQVHGLIKRLEATGIERVVIGISGGLDSTHALIVCARAFDRLGLGRDQILAYTMPGFATSRRTYDNAIVLMQAIGSSANEIDIKPSCLQMLRDIGHPFADGEPLHDTTFENVQAGERTSHLFRLANLNRALVVGTGDLSELALGWATYGVGDQMSHYNVNASVPKTLIQHLIRWVIERQELGADTGTVLQSILDTEISPELVPPSDDDSGGQPAQSTERIIGPYELQDFHLYYLTRYGYRPSKVAYLSHHAWSNRQSGSWPETLPAEDRREYTLDDIKHWLEVFIRRFYELSQFKRSALPNGPKVGSGGSLSPRGDWRAPSDASAQAWLQELRDNVP